MSLSVRDQHRPPLAILHHNIDALGPTQAVQSLPKGGDTSLCFWIMFGIGRNHDAPHAPALLRACRERHHRPRRARVRLSQPVEQRFCLYQILRFQSLSEARMDRSKQVKRFITSALIAPKRSKLPRQLEAQVIWPLGWTHSRLRFR
jgi:hypothetical protein